jgi:predicted transcriptional regulator
MSCYLDVSKLDCQPDDLLIRIRKLKFVQRAEMAPMKGKIFSNFLFPISIQNKRRAIVFEAKSLFGMLENSFFLDNAQDPKASTETLHKQGRYYAREIIETIRKKNTSPENHFKLTEAVKDYFRACGWGLIEFTTNGETNSAVITDLPESEMAAGPGTAAGSFLLGMMEGIIDGTRVNEKVSILGESYNKEKRALSVMFRVEKPVQEVKPKILELANEEDFSMPSELSSDRPVPKILVPDSEPLSPTNDMGKLVNLSTISKILDAAKSGAYKVSIMNKALVSFSDATRYLDLLTKSELLDATKTEEADILSYKTTLRGMKFLEIQERLDGMLSNEIPITGLPRVLENLVTS